MMFKVFSFKKKCIFWLILFISIQSRAQEILPLWPEGQMPNSKGVNIQDSISNERMMQVGKPYLRAFFTSIQENKGAAVLIIPGGGYRHLAFQISGDQLAKWFNTLGINAFVLIHRLPHSPDLQQREIAPLQDAQRAMQLIRSHAADWGIDTSRVGVMGSSAGGHLAATLGTLKTNHTSIGDSSLTDNYMPDFMILISPVIDLGEFAHQGSRDNLLGENTGEVNIRQYSLQYQVNENTPPTFICHAFDDTVVSPFNSMLFYEALLKNNIPSTLHIFPQGAHAIALRNNPGSANLWTDVCEQWLMEMKIKK